MKISGVARGQWKQLVKSGSSDSYRKVSYKILRAVVMGKVSHVFESHDYIIRYQDLNILVSKSGIVMTIWRDDSIEVHLVHEDIKKQYDSITSFNENDKKANQKHKRILFRIKSAVEIGKENNKNIHLTKYAKDKEVVFF